MQYIRPCCFFKLWTLSIVLALKSFQCLSGLLVLAYPFSGCSLLRPLAAHAQLPLPRKHTHSISTKPFEAATCSDGLCVQLYNSTTYSKKETNTMNFVFYTPTVVFSAQKKFISATVRLSPAESNSKGVFRRGLYHNVEFLSISTLAFCIHTLELSALQKNL